MKKWIGVTIVVPALAFGWKARHDLRDRLIPGTDTPVSFQFEDETREKGITFVHESPTLAMGGNMRLFFLAPGAAVADFDGDGDMDFFIPNAKRGSRSHLYLNRPDEGFVEAAQAWGIAEL